MVVTVITVLCLFDSSVVRPLGSLLFSTLLNNNAMIFIAKTFILKKNSCKWNVWFKEWSYLHGFCYIQIASQKGWSFDFPDSS